MNATSAASAPLGGKTVASSGRERQWPSYEMSLAPFNQVGSGPTVENANAWLSADAGRAGLDWVAIQLYSSDN